jgi:HSP20 family protein
MALVQWDPFRELNSLHDQMNGLFNQAFGPSSTQLLPITDVYSQDDKEMVIEVHLPNFAENEITVDVQDGSLVISAEHQEKEEAKGRKYLVRESSSSFYRRVALPKQANQDAIKAHFNKGVLQVTVPFRELPKPKKVAIESGEKKKK